MAHLQEWHPHRASPHMPWCICPGTYTLVHTSWCIYVPWCICPGAYALVHTPWCIYLGAYALVHTPWCICLGAYALVHTPWCSPQNSRNTVQAQTNWRIHKKKVKLFSFHPNSLLFKIASITYFSSISTQPPDHRQLHCRIVTQSTGTWPLKLRKSLHFLRHQHQQQYT